MRSQLSVVLAISFAFPLWASETKNAMLLQQSPEAQTQTNEAPPVASAVSATTATPANSPQAVPPPLKAQAFQFSKIDLELLRQVDAFDKYIEERGWVYNDPETNTYLEKLGMSLVPKETPEHVKWRFRALRDLEVNAFALPNGSIYVNSGLVARMENEAQLAGVLAHEITHVVNRHSYFEYHSARKKMVAIDIIVAAASAAYYAGVNPAIVSAMGNLLPMLVVSTMYGYSRELEHEADVYAVNTVFVQGYDIHEFARGFELLRRGPEVDLSRESAFWSSHPKLLDRVQYVDSMAAKLQPNATGLRVEGLSYRTATCGTVRQNAGLAMMLGRPRTAVANAERLIKDDPANPSNFVLLGDAYRTLGARTPTPEDEELTDSAKNETRKLLSKMTLTEYEKSLFSGPQAQSRWESNIQRSEEAFDIALALDENDGTAYRGLGFLDERRSRNAEACVEFKKYLELTPNAKDARQIRLHIENLEKALATSLTPKRGLMQ